MLSLAVAVVALCTIADAAPAAIKNMKPAAGARRNMIAQNALNTIKQAAAAHQANPESRRRRQDEPLEPTFPRQIFSEIFYESSDFSVPETVTATGQLYADGIVMRSRFDLVFELENGEFPLSTQFHDDESMEWEIYSNGPTSSNPSTAVWPFPIECYYFEEFPIIEPIEVWEYLGPYFYGSHAADAFYAINRDTNNTHYWMQDLYDGRPFLNAYVGVFTEEILGYLPITSRFEPQAEREFIIPTRLDCQPLSAAAAETKKSAPSVFRFPHTRK